MLKSVSSSPVVELLLVVLRTVAVVAVGKVDTAVGSVDNPVAVGILVVAAADLFGIPVAVAAEGPVLRAHHGQALLGPIDLQELCCTQGQLKGWNHSLGPTLLVDFEPTPHHHRRLRLLVLQERCCTQGPPKGWNHLFALVAVGDFGPAPNLPRPPHRIGLQELCCTQGPPKRDHSLALVVMLPRLLEGGTNVSRFEVAISGAEYQAFSVSAVLLYADGTGFVADAAGLSATQLIRLTAIRWTAIVGASKVQPVSKQRSIDASLARDTGGLVVLV